MLISVKWLEQYLPKGIHLTDKELKEKITFALAEVENVKRVGDRLKNIVVGEIKTIEPHPRSTKLQIATVDIGSQKNKTIVCGADNIFQDAKIPVALPGGITLHPEQKIEKQKTYQIKEVEILEIKSEGMLCSQKELGISNSHKGIWILPDETRIGDDFVAIISDTVLEIENKSLTHRPDCFGHLGIAREVSAILDTPFQYNENEEIIIPTKNLPLTIKIQDQDLCQRYTAITIQELKVAPSPLWLQLKLLSCNVRPVNNIVDITNYIMLDTGQPLHTFDYDKLHGSKIIVRTAKKREQIETIDGTRLEFKKNHLLICDQKKPVALAGIIGGTNSAISKKTKNIVIEAANFEMYNIRRTSRELGIRSEASTRFEKGLDPHLPLTALKKAIQLITEIAGGEVASEIFDFHPKPSKDKILELEIASIQRILGINPSKEQIIEMLRSLGLEIQSPETVTTKLCIKIPTFRGDLNIKEDLLEEIARLYGYNKFKPTLPHRDLKPAVVNPKRKFEKVLKRTLSALGFNEIYTYSFVGKNQYENTLMDIHQCIELKNPISPKLGYMRNDLVPSLLEKTCLNLINFDNLAIFEISRIYLKGKNKEGLPKQPKHITGIVCSDMSTHDLFFNLKGKVLALLRKINTANTDFEQKKSVSYLHPYQQATLSIESNYIGQIGILHPQVQSNWKIQKNTAVFSLKFDKLFKNACKSKKYKKTSKYPYVKRDLSFWIEQSTKAGEITQTIKNIQDELIKDVKITDIYQPPKTKNRKSMTIQVILQSNTKTLTENNISLTMKRVMQSIDKLGGKIRTKK